MGMKTMAVQSNERSNVCRKKRSALINNKGREPKTSSMRKVKIVSKNNGRFGTTIFTNRNVVSGKRNREAGIQSRVHNRRNGVNLSVSLTHAMINPNTTQTMKNLFPITFDLKSQEIVERDAFFTAGSLLQSNDVLWKMGEGTPMSLSLRVWSRDSMKKLPSFNLDKEQRTDVAMRTSLPQEHYVQSQPKLEHVSNAVEQQKKTKTESPRSVHLSSVVASTPDSSIKHDDSFVTPNDKQVGSSKHTTISHSQKTQFSKRSFSIGTKKSSKTKVRKKRGKNVGKVKLSSARSQGPAIFGSSPTDHKASKFTSPEKTKKGPQVCGSVEKNRKNCFVVTPVHEDIVDSVTSLSNSHVNLSVKRSPTEVKDDVVRAVAVVGTATSTTTITSFQKKVSSNLVCFDESRYIMPLSAFSITSPIRSVSTSPAHYGGEEEDFCRSILKSPPRNASNKTLQTTLLQRAKSFLEDMDVAGDIVDDDSDFDLPIAGHCGIFLLADDYEKDHL